VLGVMFAKDLDEALRLANDTPYGLTAGLHSLDEREHSLWTEKIVAGNLYINNGITGAVVNRQPFGGCKDSAFGGGHKAGGPNYLFNFVKPTQQGLPPHEAVPDGRVQNLSHWVEQQLINEAEKKQWHASIGSYAYWWKHHFSRKRDPNRLIGQDNFSYYSSWPISLRIFPGDQALDVYRACAAALTCGTQIEVSAEAHQLQELFGPEGSRIAEHLTGCGRGSSLATTPTSRGSTPRTSDAEAAHSVARTAGAAFGASGESAGSRERPYRAIALCSRSRA